MCVYVCMDRKKSNRRREERERCVASTPLPSQASQLNWTVSIVILVEAVAVAFVVIVYVALQLSQVFVGRRKYHQVLRERNANVMASRG